MKQLFRYQLSYYLECDQEYSEISRIKAEMLLKMIDVISETKCTYVVKDHNGKIRPDPICELLPPSFLDCY